jgi:hypothetical protein
MRDIWIRKSWLRLATGLLALAIIAAIWINYRWGTGRDAPPPPPASEGTSGYLGIMPAGGIAYAGKRDHVRIHAAHEVELAAAVAADHQRIRSARSTLE